MKKGLRQRLTNYRNDYRYARTASGSPSRGLRNAVFNAFSDVVHRSRRLNCDFSALSESDLCQHSDTVPIRKFPRAIVRCKACHLAFALERDALDRAQERHGGDYFLANKDFLYADGKPDLFS